MNGFKNSEYIQDKNLHMLRFFLCCLLLQQIPALAQDIRLPGIPFPLNWQNEPLRYSVRAQVLTIESGPKTDMFRDPQATYNTDNAPKLLFTPDADFVLSAAVAHAFHNKWDGGALVLIADSLHWIKCCFEKDYTGARRVVSVVTKNISDDCNSVSVPGNKTWFKLAKSGDAITFYHSADGKKWFLVRHFQMPGFTTWKLGFLAQSPTGSNCRVQFSDIRYRAVKIKDPYKGE